MKTRPDINFNPSASTQQTNTGYYNYAATFQAPYQHTRRLLYVSSLKATPIPNTATPTSVLLDPVTAVPQGAGSICIYSNIIGSFIVWFSSAYTDTTLIAMQAEHNIIIRDQGFSSFFERERALSRAEQGVCLAAARRHLRFV